MAAARCSQQESAASGRVLQWLLVHPSEWIAWLAAVENVQAAAATEVNTWP
ncbi:MAG: hypothetical protein ACI91B_005128 [Planctomycetota bacterium]